MKATERLKAADRNPEKMIGQTKVAKGRRVAEDTYEWHDTFRRLLISLGVDEKTAALDACEMEHAVNPASYEALKMLVEKQKEKV